MLRLTEKVIKRVQYNNPLISVRHLSSDETTNKKIADYRPSENTLADSEVEERKRKAVEEFIASQMGREKAELAQILQKCGVVVKGGPKEAHELMDALLEWKGKESGQR